MRTLLGGLPSFVLVFGLVACAGDSPRSDAPLRGSGGAGGGSGLGNNPAPDASGETDGGGTGEALHGEVLFTDIPNGAVANGQSITTVRAQFLAQASPVEWSSSCSLSEFTEGAEGCRRIDCPAPIDTIPESGSPPPYAGTPISAGELRFQGLVGLERLVPNEATYSAAVSEELAFWQGGATVSVSAEGAEFPAFSEEVVTLTSLSLLSPAPVAERRLLSRAEGFTFRIGVTVPRLQLILTFGTTAFQCASAGSELHLPPEMVADLADDISPTLGLLYGEVLQTVEVPTPSALPAQLLVRSRRMVTTESGAPLSFSSFVVVP